MIQTFTFQDAIEHLQNFTQGAVGDIEQRIMRTVSRLAYRDLVEKHDWVYMVREAQFNLVGPQSDGSVVYDHTGGSSERLLQLKDAAVTGVTDGTPITVTLDTDAYETGDTVAFIDVGGFTFLNHDGTTSKDFTVTRTASATYTLDGTTTQTQTWTSGGIASENQWPTWAAFGRVQVASNIYEIATRRDALSLTLSSTLNPGEDVSSTTYTIFRNTYPLADDCQRVIVWLVDKSSWWTERYLQPYEWQAMERAYVNFGEPFRWTIMKSPEAGGDGRLVIRLVGYPGSEKILAYLYQSRGTTTFRRTGFETSSSAGTIAATADSTTITGTSTTFTTGPSMVGAYLRIGSSATVNPTSIDGIEPYVEEHKIASVTDNTTIVLETPVSATTSGVKYTVSDHIDLAPEMLPPYMRSLEKQWSIMTRDSDRIPVAALAYEEALRQAMEQNHKAFDIRAVGNFGASPGLFRGNPRDVSFGSTVSTGP